jgi:dipeptidyl-peptidase-4
VHSWSTADTPGGAEVRGIGRAGGQTAEGEPDHILPLPSAPSRIDFAALPRFEFLTIPGPDGTPLPARLLKPAGFDPGRRYPVIVYQYGGPGSQTVVNRWDRRRRDLFHKRMAQLGFAVLTVDGRSTAFFGKAGEDLDHRKMGEVNLAAQLAAVDYLKTQRWADTDRLGLWGWSGGGYNTLFCMLTRPGVWKAGVAGAPVTDWHLYDAVWTERYLGTPGDNESGFLESSPINLAARLKDRLLIVHGLADDNVHPENSVNMIDELVKAGRPVEQGFYPGEKHAMRPPSIRHFFERMEEFWVRTLMAVEIGDVEVR